MSTPTLPTIDAGATGNFPARPMTQDEFFDFCQQNADTRFERTAEGEIIIMAPSGGESGFQDAEVVIDNLAIGPKPLGKEK